MAEISDEAQLFYKAIDTLKTRGVTILEAFPGKINGPNDVDPPFVRFEVPSIRSSAYTKCPDMWSRRKATGVDTTKTSSDATKQMREIYLFCKLDFSPDHIKSDIDLKEILNVRYMRLYLWAVRLAHTTYITNTRKKTNKNKTK